MELFKIKINFIIVPCVILVILLCVSKFYDTDSYFNVSSKTVEPFPSRFQGREGAGRAGNNTALELTLAKVLEQRNNVSRALNLLQQKVGQMECQQVSQNEKVSSTGGWCAQSSPENSGQHMTDTKLASALANFFKGKYVGSFGDGPGRYKQVLLDTGLLKGYDAYDGAPFSEKTSQGRVQFLDLTLPQYGLPMYDWIISLEVAEHIPEKYESIFIDNVVRHAKEGVVLSWARLGQGGYSHVNNRPIEYVKNLFLKLGFMHDAENSTKLQTAASLDWLKWNTNVYRRIDVSNAGTEVFS